MPCKIIGGRRYDTQTATQIVTKWSDIPSLENEEEMVKYRETLYRKSNGKYFIYSLDTGTNEWSIQPLRNKKKAMDWTLQNFSAAKVEQIWGPFPE